MTYQPQEHPLHGVGLETMLSALVRHYGWPVLASQIPINCFKSYPTFKSAVTFLKKTEWARERVEAFYLYKFKQCELPSDEEHQLAPRNRHVVPPEPPKEPAQLDTDDPEFFDDPASGAKFPSRKEVQHTQAQRRGRAASPQTVQERVIERKPTKQGDSGDADASDPWAKWRKAD